MDTITVDHVECGMSQLDGLSRMPDFARWLFVLLTKCSRSIINVNDLALHLCSYRGGLLLVQLAEGGYPFPPSHKHKKRRI